MRIVSLLPSATEMMGALGLADQLVGVTHRCDWPEEIQHLPKVTQMVMHEQQSPSEISAKVKLHKDSGRRMFKVDEELVQSLNPDIIMTQSVCNVCAVPEEQAEYVASFMGGNVRTINLQARRLEDIFANLLWVGHELGVRDRAEQVVADMRQRLHRIQHFVANLPKPRVFAAEWIDPIKSTGTWLPDLITAAGGKNLISQPGDKVRTIPWQEIVEAQPEVLFILPCGCPLEQIIRDAPLLAQHPGWEELPAVRSGRVFLMDGNICSRHGVRIIDAIETLARLMHPEVFEESVNMDEALSWNQAYNHA